jgi:hypothetical protein
MRHAMMNEVTKIERVGEIVQMGQFVRDLEFSRFSGHGTSERCNTSKAVLAVDSKRHRYSVNGGVE